MRVTNKMMTNNMLYNINNNKNAMDKLNNQYATGLKIQRPSDDPIIAVRALKLRTNLSELNQYYEKNIPDAMSWMDVTENAMRTANTLASEVHTYCVQGATDTLTESDRNYIAEMLQQYKQQYYEEGNANYAGRYVFTGFKTDTSLVFAKDTTNVNYQITEQFDGNNIDIIKVAKNSLPVDAYDPAAPAAMTFDDMPNVISAYRVRLAYDNLKGEESDIPLKTPVLDEGRLTYDDEGRIIMDEDDRTLVIKFPVLDDLGRYTYDSDGNMEMDEFAGTINYVLSSEEGAYEPEEGTINFLYDSGELILSADVYEEWRKLPEMRVTYEKDTFKKSDLRPEHFFDSITTDIEHVDDGSTVYTKENQEMKYEINFNQQLTINTQGADAFRHSFGRQIDEILNKVDDVIRCQDKIKEVERLLSDTNNTDEQNAVLTKMLDTLKTESSLKTEIMRSAFESGLTAMDNEQAALNHCIADSGSRYIRLQLTESRLATEQVSFEELLSNNEDADLVDTIVRFNSLQQVYNASLSAASKVVQNTLLDFL